MYDKLPRDHKLPNLFINRGYIFYLSIDGILHFSKNNIIEIAPKLLSWKINLILELFKRKSTNTYKYWALQDGLTDSGF